MKTHVTRVVACFALLLIGFGSRATAQVIEKKSLNLEGAKLVAAVAAAGTASSPLPATTFVPAVQVNAAFAMGMPLVETGAYKVHASRRDAPGMAEVHVRDTDIIYVLEGTATLVTGGEVVDGRPSAPEEIRGASIRGGEPRRLAKGDLLIVPAGVPHWFEDVPAPFVYYVVKTTSAGGGSE